MQEIRLREIKFRLRKKYFRLHELKKREGECFKTSASLPQLFFNFYFFFFNNFQFLLKRWLIFLFM